MNLNSIIYCSGLLRTDADYGMGTHLALRVNTFELSLDILTGSKYVVNYCNFNIILVWFLG